MYKYLWFVILLILLWAGSSEAAVIYMKDGRVVKGSIVREETYKIVVIVDGTPRDYYVNEIERIDKSDEKPQAETKATEFSVVAVPGGLGGTKTTLIKRLLELNGVRESIGKMFLNIIQQSPEGMQAEAERLLDVDAVIDQLLPIYSKHYDEEELKALIGFYSSPVGQKNRDLTPVLMQETMDVMVKYFTKMMKSSEASGLTNSITTPLAPVPQQPQGESVK